VLVMISSMSMPICNCFHAIRANIDKITNFRGAPFFDARVRSFLAIAQKVSISRRRKQYFPFQAAAVAADAARPLKRSDLSLNPVVVVIDVLVHAMFFLLSAFFVFFITFLD